MKKLQLLFLFLVLTIVGCEDEILKKPENLVKENLMIDMLVDIHLAEATYNRFRHDSIMENNSSANFYYSVLEKYQVPDSVFEQSFVFYASKPKNFEKMYRKVMNNLSQLEQEYSGRKEILEFERPKEKK